MAEPQVLIGRGRSQIVLRGKDAIEAGGWTVKLLFIARAVAIMMGSTVATLVLARLAGLL
jgi:hypothetical protein